MRSPSWKTSIASYMRSIENNTEPELKIYKEDLRPGVQSPNVKRRWHFQHCPSSCRRHRDVIELRRSIVSIKPRGVLERFAAACVTFPSCSCIAPIEASARRKAGYTRSASRYFPLHAAVVPSL